MVKQEHYQHNIHQQYDDKARVALIASRTIQGFSTTGIPDAIVIKEQYTAEYKFPRGIN